MIEVLHNSVGFKGVLTSLPVTQLKEEQYGLEADHSNGVMQSLAAKYRELTGIAITNDYELHIFHIDEILKWEETKEVIGPFFTSVLTQGIGDPLRYLSRLLVTGRVNKNIIVIEVDEKTKLKKIKDDTLKLSISAETIFIE